MNKTSASSLNSAVCFGAEHADHLLTQGLRRAALHEIYDGECDSAAGSSFALMLAIRAAKAKPIVVVRDDRCVQTIGRLYGSGIADLGGNPDDLIVIHTPDVLATLRAAADAVACSEIGAVLIEPWAEAPQIDLTITRRLSFRAEQSGVFTLLIRVGGTVVPSAAVTRWQVRSLLSTPLAAQSPGHPAFEISLLRHRGGIAGFAARVEWNREHRRFCDASVSGAIPAVAAGRARDTGERRAA